MSLPDGPSQDAPPEEATEAETSYGSLSIEDDEEGTVDPGELAGGANEDDQDVS